jgi:hypothetical protein
MREGKTLLTVFDEVFWCHKYEIFSSENIISLGFILVRNKDTQLKDRRLFFACSIFETCVLRDVSEKLFQMQIKFFFCLIKMFSVEEMTYIS